MTLRTLPDGRFEISCDDAPNRTEDCARRLVSAAATSAWARDDANDAGWRSSYHDDKTAGCYRVLDQCPGCLTFDPEGWDEQ